MALVLLPCDLPTWAAVQKHLSQLRAARSEPQVIDCLTKIHQLCCVSLDPDEDESEAHSFAMLQTYLSSLGDAEQAEFYDTTLPTIVDYAMKLKTLKPTERSLCYSLQQQSHARIDQQIKLRCFFRYFNRIKENPPTGEISITRRDDFLVLSSSGFFPIDQQIKLRCFFRYFNRIKENPPTGEISITRRVMPARDHMRIEDWAECRQRLCPVVLVPGNNENNNGVCSKSATDGVRVTRCVSANAAVGAGLLSCASAPSTSSKHRTHDKFSQDEVTTMITRPELMVTMCCVEALEDNESLTVDGTRQFSDIRVTVSPTSEDLTGSRKVEDVDSTECKLCLIDAEDFSECPVSQFEEIWILRELNKAVIGFDSPDENVRLSPLGESRSGSPESYKTQMRQSTNKLTRNGDSSISQQKLELRMTSRKAVSRLQDLAPTMTTSMDTETAACLAKLEQEDQTVDSLSSIRSLSPKISMEKVQTSKHTERTYSTESNYLTCCEDSEEFLSAGSSIDNAGEIDKDAGDDDEGLAAFKLLQGRTSRRGTFAERLREALERQTEEENKLPDDDQPILPLDPPVDEEVADIIQDRRQWLESKTTESSICNNHSSLSRGNSSRYSFSSEYGSDVDEMCNKFSHWFSPPQDGADKRQLLVSQFAQKLLIRTLSDSFASICSADNNAKIYSTMNRRPKVEGKSQSVPSTTPAAAPTTSINKSNAANCSRRLGNVLCPDGEVIKKGHQHQELSIVLLPLKNHHNPKKSPRTAGHRAQQQTLLHASAAVSPKTEEPITSSPPAVANLNPDVLEGFSYTLAETLVETVLREMVISRRASLPALPSKPLRKGILKNRSKSYWHIGASEPSSSESDGLMKQPLARLLAESSLLQRSSSWHQLFFDKRRGSDEHNNLVKTAGAGPSDAVQPNQGTAADCLSKLKNLAIVPGLPRPLLTGNWGCDNKMGDPQLKFLLQWLAASKCNTPCMVYYTQDHPKLNQAEAVLNTLQSSEWTIGEVVCMLLEYSHALLESLHHQQQQQQPGNSENSPKPNHQAIISVDSPETNLFHYILSPQRTKPTNTEMDTKL
ncbi:unnamed protein product [Notodromas monacha]|uniref:PARG catalytic Macro domain-containing protein n=1 Tax=Notodromas monacha TaxID=399045 RepID=A0A7R9BXZ1_9CRUS|nr:unnamed protein product [Notodromas monacha]CAG0922472.1 unnamed protein product [Notodromas monacha]